MTYFSKVIQPGEKVLFEGTIHWNVYIGASLTGILGVVLIVGYSALGAIVLILSALMFCNGWLKRNGTEIVVTDRRIIYKRGLLSRTTLEMNISKVESVDVVQSLAGRVLGFGTVLVRGTGSTWEPLRGVARPLDLRNAITAG